MPKFYNLSGEQIGESQFIETYGKIYDDRFKGCELERIIEEILVGEQKLDRENLKNILRWKTGGLCINDVIYSSWNSNNNILVDDVWDKLEKYTTICFCDPFSTSEREICIKILKDLRSAHGMGITYSIAILYFLSNGKYPLYDRFAQIAITAICNGKNLLHDAVQFKPLGQSVSEVFDGAYKSYYENLKGVFKDQYTSRNVDKALWIYGHLFKKNED